MLNNIEMHYSITNNSFSYFWFSNSVLTSQIVHCFPRFPTVNVSAVKVSFVSREKLFIGFFYMIRHKSNKICNSQHQSQCLLVTQLHTKRRYYLAGTAMIGFMVRCRCTLNTPRDILEHDLTIVGNIFRDFN